MRVIEKEVRDLRIAFIGSPLVSPPGSTSKPSLGSPTKSAPEPPSEVLARLSELSLQMRSLDARLASLASPVSTSSSPISPSTSTDEDAECCLCALLSRVRRVTVEVRREELVAFVTHPLTGVCAAVLAAATAGLVLVLRR